MKNTIILILASYLLLSSALLSQNCTITLAFSSVSVCPGFHSTVTAVGATSYTWTNGSGSVTGSTFTADMGCYTVSATSGTCNTTKIFCIGSAPYLNVTAAASNSVTCIASNFPKFSKLVTLSASGAGSYLWEPYDPAFVTYSLGASTSVRPPASTCYTVTGYTSTCSGTAAVCVTVIPQFAINVVPAQSTICAGSSQNLGIVSYGGPPPSVTYIWSEPGSGQTLNNTSTPSVIASPTVATTYTLEVKDANGCIALPFEAKVDVKNCPVSISERGALAVSIYPNPFGEFILLSSEENILDVKITDLRGIELDVSQMLEGGRRLILNTSGLPAGIYFLRVKSENGNSRIVKVIRN
jgi:hypothetical protein